MRRLGSVLLCCAIGVLSVASSSADEAQRGPRNGYGIRAGGGFTPDQFVVGAQFLLGEKLRVLRLAPSFDLGFGDNVTTYIANVDFLLHSSLPGSRSQIYLGLGPALVVWDHKDTGADTEVGLSFVGGTRLATSGRTNYNVEARFGVGDAPDFRILLGIMFGSGRVPGEY